MELNHLSPAYEAGKLPALSNCYKLDVSLGIEPSTSEWGATQNIQCFTNIKLKNKTGSVTEIQTRFSG